MRAVLLVGAAGAAPNAQREWPELPRKETAYLFCCIAVTIQFSTEYINSWKRQNLLEHEFYNKAYPVDNVDMAIV
jgi:hypothetical protein